MKNKNTTIMLALFLLTIVLASLTIGAPGGADLTEGPDERGSNSSVNSATAQAGNTTNLQVDQNLITGIWQGFFGNVSGNIVLQDSSQNNFYDWTYATLSGEVLATRAGSVSWSAVNCSNSTYWEAEETALFIEGTDIDGVNETYSGTGHTAFDLSGETKSSCPSTQAYTSGGSGLFWNVMLQDGTNTVYAALINADSTAFDGTEVDFELLVPVNENTGASTYNFYVELG